MGGPGSGGQPKPTATLKLEGGYRDDRHGDRVDQVVVGDKPRKPQHLKGPAATAWKHLVETTPEGVYGEQDTEVLTAYCEAWGKYRAAADAGEDAKMWRALQHFIKLAGKVGAGPVDRTRLAI